MNLRRTILLAALCAAPALAASARTGYYPITTEQIAALAAGEGLQVTPAEISLLSSVVATVPQPALKLRSVKPAPNYLLIARVECADSSQCLPFMVALRLSSGVAPPAPAPEMKPVSRSSPPAPILVRSGSTATLLLDGPHVHISIAVVCLENGTLGQTVRASNPDRSQYYTVQVVGSQLLRGRL